jgi:DNA-binding transcriptional LysR family regulator
MDQFAHALPDVALFVEVARAGSFRNAAARLELPASTLSRRIAALEARLGVRLFLRTTRNVTLAPVARPYYEQCLAVLDAAAKAHAALVSSHEQPGRVRIAMPVDLGVEVLGPIVAAFVTRRPGMTVDLELSSRAVDLHRDPIDLAFRIGRTLDDRVVARKIADIASGVYAAPAFLQRFGPLSSPAGLARVQCLNLQTAQGPMPWKVGNHHWDAAPGPHAIAANSVALLRTLAELGHGLALLPEHIAAPSVRLKRLVRVLPEEPTPRWPLYAITATRLVPRQVGLLIAHVKGALRESPLAMRPGR